jgi:regulation of enolase protein 1 (concanavalin A-like superfamily)
MGLAHFAGWIAAFNMKHWRSSWLICVGGLISFLGRAGDLTGTDLGGPTLAGSTETNATGRIVVSGSGTGMGLRVDQGHFAWTLQNGDFDVAVRLESLVTPDVFGRAGIMARTSLDPDSMFAGVFATPTVAGILFQARETAGSSGRLSGAVPANYPQAWLRLQRVGDVVTGAASTDGKLWTKLDTATVTSTNSLYLGLAVTSWSSNNVATAVFDDWSEGTGPIQPAVTPATELPGPSSRRTGLVISEIMYHPAPRSDGRNLEFIELFNSQSILADISGCQLSGAVEFTFPPETVLPAGGFVVVAAVPGDMRAVYGLTNVLGGYTGGLNISSGQVQLRSRIGAVLLEARYDSQPPWPAAADGAGHSLVLARPSYGERNSQAWASSALRGGSPGRWDPVLRDPLSQVVINELRSRSTAPAGDFVELYNAGGQPVDLSGAFLSDNLSLGRFRIPNGTGIPAHGFLQFDESTLGFALSAAGETVYFTAPDYSRVVDAVRFGATPVGTAYGRTPDGAPRFCALAQPTPGQPNTGAFQSPVVINEIMFNPISSDADDQYVELFNRGAAPITLAGWRFTSGITFTFPAGVVLPPDGYLVVARNAARMLTNYSELTPATCLGDFQGSLSAKGELLRLARPETITPKGNNGGQTTKTLWITEAEVSYHSGGRWGQWSDAGGSSLELIDPHADATLASNWADSDESAKGQWTTVEQTGVLDLGDPTYGINQVQILLNGSGECLVDNVEVIGPAGTNMVTNGDFEKGLTGWASQGSHSHSALESGTGVGGTQCLHLRAESGGDPGANRIRGAIANGLKEGQTATLRAQVRWLRGFPEIVIRLRGDYLEAVGRLDTSAHLGTPGRRNSRAVTNAPPAIYDVVHSPILPAADQAVLVTARINDPDGTSSVVLRYRVDPAADLTDVRMRDDGTNGDAVAGDGLFSGIIPGQPAGTLVAFHVAAADASPALLQGTFPATAPVQECLVRFGELQPGSTFGAYHIWMTQATKTRWTTREKLSNEPLDVTFVYGNQRVIYNAGAAYAGSPFVSSGYSGPTGALCGYVVRFPDDDLFLGITDLKLDWPVRDNTLQMEQVAYWIADEMGVPSNHRRFVHLYINGSRRGVIYEDAQQPNSDMVAQYFPQDKDGELYKIDDWFEFDNAGSGFVNHDATLDNFTTTGGEKKVARYRWNWRKRAMHQSTSDYRNLFALVDATQPADFNSYTQAMEAVMDIDEYLGVVALEHLVGNWDSFGFYRGKNMYTYKPASGRWNLLSWDIDFVLSAQGYATDFPLFATIDPAVSQMMYHPPFQRTYYRILENAANGPMQAPRFGPILAGNYAALIANGINAAAPAAGSNYLNARLKFVRQQLAQVQSPFALATNQTTSTPLNLIPIQGTAPVGAREILVNGLAYPVTWMDVNHWQIQVPLAARSNALEIVAVDGQGRPLTGAKANLTVEYTGPIEGPEGHIVFNEIMYAPRIPGAQYVELHNTSLYETFDLSGWQIGGLGYTFPTGTIFGPDAFLVLAQDRTAFWQAYGPDLIPADVFAGHLSTQGETLRLIRPGATPAQDATVAEVSYSARPPWPQAATTGGISLQLRDPLRDQNRVGNWSARTPDVAAEWEFVSVTAPAKSSRLLVYLSGLPAIRDLSTIEGAWDGFIQGSLAYRVEFRPAAGGGWEGDFIYQMGNEEQRFTMPLVTLTNGVLTFGFSDQNPEFTFSFSGAPMTVSGQYQSQGQTSMPASLKRSNPGGDVYLDDLWLTKGSTSGVGTNVLQNGDFEAPLAGSWTVSSNHLSSAISADIKHSGSSSLHLAASVGGYDDTLSVWQDVPAIETGGTYTLSYWVHRGANATAVVLRLADWSLASVRDVRPPQQKPVSATPGEINSTYEQLPPFPLLWLNEIQPVNLTGPADSSGRRSPWVELFNSSTNTISLAQFTLANAYSNAIYWSFPVGAEIKPGEFRLVWLDGHSDQSTAAEWHASFQAPPGVGVVVLSLSSGSEQQVIDYLEYSNLPDGSSLGWAADGVPQERVIFSRPTPLAGNTAPAGGTVVINEWMAANTQTTADPIGGGYEDWFELYNPGATAVDLTGYALSDSVTVPRKFVIPQGTVIPAQGFLLVWADNHPERNQPGHDLHVPFKLSASGELILLTALDGTRADLVSFGPQAQDVSEGRWPDGAATAFRRLSRPTPGAANVWINELRLTAVAATDQTQIELSWASTAGQQFWLQSKDDLNEPNWLEVSGSIVATGPDTRVTLPTLNQAPHRFYRLLLIP